MRCERHRWCLAALVIIAFSAASPVMTLGVSFAGETGPPISSPSVEAPSVPAIPPIEERALAFYEAAQRASANGRKAEAVALLRSALEIDRPDRSWVYLYPLGVLLNELGKPREAAESFAACLRALPEREAAVFKKKVEREGKKASARVGTITVDANVPGAEIIVDGKMVGAVPLAGPIFVDPGDHLVEAKAPGYDPDGIILSMASGASGNLSLKLEPAAAGTGELTRSPLELAHRARKPAAALQEQEKRVKAEQPDDRTSNTLLMSGMGLGAIGVAIGIAGLFMAEEKWRGVEEVTLTLVRGGRDRPCSFAENLISCDEAGRGLYQAKAYAAMSIGGFVASGTGGALVIYELIQRHSARSARSARSNSVAHMWVDSLPGGGAIVLMGGSF